MRAVLTLHGEHSDYSVQQLVWAGPWGADSVGPTKLQKGPILSHVLAANVVTFLSAALRDAEGTDSEGTPNGDSVVAKPV